MQVLPQDVDSQYGIAQSPIGPSPSQSPLAFQPFGRAPSGPPTAYTSALALSATASGSGNLSRLSQSPSDSTATATATTSRGPAASAEQADAAPGVAVSGGSSRGGDQQPPMGVTPPSEDSGSVRSTSGGGGEIDTLVDNAQAAQARDQPASPSSAVEPAITSPPSPRPPASSQDLQASDPSQGQGDSGIAAVSSPSTDQPPTDSQDPAQAAGLDAASLAGNESQAAAPPSSTELQQSMKAVLSGEDQAMQASLAAANAAGGEQVKDMLVPSPAPSSQGGPPLAQADHPYQADPSLAQASAPWNPPSESPPLQAAHSSPNVSEASTLGLSTDVAAGKESTASRAVGLQEQQPEQAGEGGNEQTWVDAEIGERTAASRGDASGQIADKFRWGSLSHMLHRWLHSHTHPHIQHAAHRGMLRYAL